MRRRLRPAARASLAGLLCLCGLVVGGVRLGLVPAEWGARAIVEPFRRPLAGDPNAPHEQIVFTGEGVRLEGWFFHASGPPRGLVIYLHGVADNRRSGAGVAQRLTPLGYDIFAFDARAHGRSSGTACTYGYRERHDVARALDALHAPRAILLGHSLGAAVALQAAAVEPRVSAVVAASSFSDLETIVRERARWFLLPDDYVDRALARAGEIGAFVPAQASPALLAPAIRVPVLLLHGAADRKTPPEHSRRIEAELRCRHQLVLLAGVGHDEILGREEAWAAIAAFLARL